MRLPTRKPNPKRKKNPWTDPIVIVTAIGSLAAVATICYAVFGTSGGGGGHTANAQAVVAQPTELGVRAVTRRPEPELEAETIVVEGIVRHLAAGYKVYAVARASATTKARSSRQGNRWFASEGVSPDAHGEWQAEINVSPPAKETLTYQAAEMQPNLQTSGGCSTCSAARFERSREALEQQGASAAGIVSRPFTPKQ